MVYYDAVRRCHRVRRGRIIKRYGLRPDGTLPSPLDGYGAQYMGLEILGKIVGHCYAVSAVARYLTSENAIYRQGKKRHGCWRRDGCSCRYDGIFRDE